VSAKVELSTQGNEMIHDKWELKWTESAAKLYLWHEAHYWDAKKRSEDKRASVHTKADAIKQMKFHKAIMNKFEAKCYGV